MKEIIKQIEHSKLIAGKVLDSLNDIEEKQYNEFKNDEQNQKIIQNILNKKEFEEWNHQMDGIDALKEWKQFVNKMQEPKKKGRVVKMRVLKAISSIAAILILAFSINLGYQIFNENGEYQTIEESDIGPGEPQAKLVLTNGEEINLKSLNAKVINTGNVLITNVQGVLKYNTLKVANQLQPTVNKLIIPKGGEYQLKLPDGTKIWMNSGSELTYALPFSNTERRVQLKGEAYFEVTHNKQKPFIVETIYQDVKVLGTEFNVSAYPEDSNIITTLVEGKVVVNSTNNQLTQFEEFLLPNEQLMLDKETSVSVKREVDTYIYTSWKDGRFKFVNEPLESFFKKLSRWYNVDVFIKDESIKEIRFSGDLPRYKNMSNILKIIEEEMSVRIEIENNKIIYVSRK
tara:strand:- start:29185 stop:30387 length:1203 start_codon:yes stop_codon:yes gene_type:complete